MLALLLLLTAVIAEAQPDRFGLPSCSGSGQELAVKEAFTLCHSAQTKTPLWTAYELRRVHLDAPSTRRASFRRDRALTHEGASNEDYRNSGWTRGHMIPARDMAANPRTFRDSFLLSNAVPQDPHMNRSIWRKLENEARRRAAAADSIIIFTGPVFCEGAAKAGRVTVPCALFKILIADHNGAVETFAVLIPNESLAQSSLDAFTATIEQLSDRTGLAFPVPR